MSRRFSHWLPSKSTLTKTNTGVKLIKKSAYDKIKSKWTKSGVTADLDPPADLNPRSKSAGGYGPPFADLDPPYQTFLLSILCIIFGK